MTTDAVRPAGLASATTTTASPEGRFGTYWQTHQKLLMALACLAPALVAGIVGFAQGQRDGSLQAGSGAAVPSQAAASMPGAGTSPFEGIPQGGPNANTGAAWPLWEFQLKDPIPPREQALTPPPWRLIGSSGVAGKWQLIVLRQGKAEPEYFRVGDQLPGNYRIEAISEEDVTLKHGRRELVLSFIGSR